MPRRTPFRVLVAVDGSHQSKIALETTVGFPWPAETEVHSVAARQSGADYRRSLLLAVLDRNAEAAAEGARRTLAGRWPDASATVTDTTPVEGVLGEAKRLGAEAIVVGWRGHGPARRLLMGSVSRGVVRGARCAVLVVRRRVPEVRRILIGVDGSDAAQRAVEFVSRLDPPLKGRVTLVSATEPVPVPSQALASGAVRATVSREVRRINVVRAKQAQSRLNAAAAKLERRGWKISTRLTTGVPLRDLLAEAARADAHVIVVGKRGTSGVPHLLLGSVAEGILNRSPLPVVVVP